jgi:hypothetical protein
LKKSERPLEWESFSKSWIKPITVNVYASEAKRETVPSFLGTLFRPGGGMHFIAGGWMLSESEFWELSAS